MNNAMISQEEFTLSLQEEDKTPLLREREAILIRIIEALEHIQQTSEWSTLKSLIFDGTAESLEKQLKFESEQLVIHVPRINQLQGQLFWARKYADLSKLTDGYRTELANIKKRIITQPTER